MEAPRAPRVLITGGGSGIGRSTPPASIAELLAYVVSDAAACVPGTVFTS